MQDELDAAVQALLRRGGQCAGSGPRRSCELPPLPHSATAGNRNHRRPEKGGTCVPTPHDCRTVAGPGVARMARAAAAAPSSGGGQERSGSASTPLPPPVVCQPRDVVPPQQRPLGTLALLVFPSPPPASRLEAAAAAPGGSGIGAAPVLHHDFRDCRTCLLCTWLLCT